MTDSTYEYDTLNRKQWEHPSDYGGFDPIGDVMIAGQSRDSDALERSNYTQLFAHLSAEEIVNEEQGILDAIAKYGDRLKDSEGHLYKARILKRHVDNMLDWDKPLSEQPESVRAFFESELPILRWQDMSDEDLYGLMAVNDKEFGNSVELRSDNTLVDEDGNILDRADLVETAESMDEYGELTDYINIKPSDNDSGRTLYESLTARIGGGSYYGTGAKGAKAASLALNEAGIPGIKFLDGNSRSAGEGTRNIVFFDPRIVEITERNGVPIQKALDTAQPKAEAPKAVEPKIDYLTDSADPTGMLYDTIRSTG